MTRRLSGFTVTTLVLVGALPAAAQSLPDYRDDRSTPQAVVESLYNAIERKEYVRAFSYFDEDAVSGFEQFQAGYTGTTEVRLRVGEATVEGAAGSLYGSVPVVVEAASTDGTLRVFTGCYETRQAQPAAQIEPPFQPIRIIAGELEASDEDFESAAGDRPDKGL